MAASYTGMGNVYDSPGKHEESLEMYQEALRIQINVFGHDHT